VLTAACDIRLDPFAADYDRAIELLDDDLATAVVDIAVESPQWRAIVPPAAPRPGRVFLVDGVRRIEHRLLVEQDGAAHYGLLGSFGVGAVSLGSGRARISHAEVTRVIVVGGGLLPDALEVRLGARAAALSFVPCAVAENTPVAPLLGLQDAMRQAEARLADLLAGAADAVFLDGPLTYLADSRLPVVGFVKRLLRPYLAAPEARLLPELPSGGRTPVFLVQHARSPRYSWYLRIAKGRPIQSPLTGVVRLECSGALPLRQAVALADDSCRLLPRLASDAAHDPRAPQNLHPIGGLEARLRRLLGDSLLVRRSVEAHLFRAVRA
jgi:hypothetical protein